MIGSVLLVIGLLTLPRLARFRWCSDYVAKDRREAVWSWLAGEAGFIFSFSLISTMVFELTLVDDPLRNLFATLLLGAVVSPMVGGVLDWLGFYPWFDRTVG